MKYLSIFVAGALVTLAGYGVFAQTLEEIVEEPTIQTLEELLYEEAPDRVKEAFATSSIPILEAIKIDKDKQNNEQVINKLDEIVSVLRNIQYVLYQK